MTNFEAQTTRYDMFTAMSINDLRHLAKIMGKDTKGSKYLLIVRLNAIMSK
jgi:hypothetical protein